MHTEDALTTLFRHNLWANLELLACCRALSSEQLDATIVGTYGAIGAMLEHIATAEQSYLARISTGQPFRRPTDAPAPTLVDLGVSLRTTGEGLLAWAARVQPEETVIIDWDGTPRAVPKTIILTQVINHATEHRAQITATLTQIGIEPPNLQGWAYFDAIDR